MKPIAAHRSPLRPSPVIVADAASAGFDYAVYIGRFQPFHAGHAVALQKALTLAPRTIVLIGTHDAARSPKNPWTTDERERMIRGAVPQADQSRLSIAGIVDAPYNDSAWLTEVQRVVERLIADDDREVASARIALIGCPKDTSSYYLRLFPNWTFVPVEHVELLNASDVRAHYFADHVGFMDSSAALSLPLSTRQFLSQFASTSHYQTLAEEVTFIAAYKTRWSAAPYAPIFTTVDAVVVAAGHVLLIRRRTAPGKGLWAVPGGFLNPEEWLLEGALRELREETRLKVPEAILRGSLRAQRVFDNPGRSLRGRTLTHAFLFEISLPADGKLPPVRGSDDATRAKWFTLAQVARMRADLFEDHYDIIHTLLASGSPAQVVQA